MSCLSVLGYRANDKRRKQGEVSRKSTPIAKDKKLAHDFHQVTEQTRFSSSSDSFYFLFLSHFALSSIPMSSIIIFTIHKKSVVETFLISSAKPPVEFCLHDSYTQKYFDIKVKLELPIRREGFIVQVALLCKIQILQRFLLRGRNFIRTSENHKLVCAFFLIRLILLLKRKSNEKWKWCLGKKYNTTVGLLQASTSFSSETRKPLLSNS